MLVCPAWAGVAGETFVQDPAVPAGIDFLLLLPGFGRIGKGNVLAFHQAVDCPAGFTDSGIKGNGVHDEPP